LKGRPALVVEQAAALGTTGDVTLADLSNYLLVGTDPQSAISADVKFLTDEIVFRFTWRIDGKPAYATAVTPFAGTNTRSPHVVLATRA
jgi:HK97 family phage major capsid protein